MYNRRNTKQSKRFSNNEDKGGHFRASRAISRREEQKNQREHLLFKHRFITPPTRSASSSLSTITRGTSQQNVAPSTSKKKITKQEREQLEKKRYFEMLAWKEKKYKKIEAEKKKRAQPFKTGHYEPDTPKFLVSNTADSTDGAPCLCRSTSKSAKKAFTPSVRGIGSKGLSSKALNFRSTTPNVINKNKLHCASGAFSHRSQRKFKALGVAPLPVTPAENTVKSKRKLNKSCKNSFAPDSFSFKVLRNVQPFHIESKNGTSTFHKSSEKDFLLKDSAILSNSISQIPSTVDVRAGSNFVYSEEGRESIPHTNESFKENSLPTVTASPSKIITPHRESRLSFNLPDLIQECYTENKKHIDSEKGHSEVIRLLGETHSDDIHDPKSSLSAFEQLNSNKRSLDQKQSPLKEKSPIICNNDDDANSPPPVLSSFKYDILDGISSTDNPPAEESLKPRDSSVRRSRSRRKSSNVNNDTPYLPRLRPRTSCSRSTRRSCSAHYDRLSLGSAGLLTPKRKSSGKKRSTRLSKTPRFQDLKSPSYESLQQDDEKNQHQETNINAKTPKVSFADQSNIISDKISPKNTEIFKTPRGILSSKKKAPAIEEVFTPIESPFVNRERSSSRKRRSGMSSVEEMFSDLPLNISCSPIDTDMKDDDVVDDQTNMQLVMPGSIEKEYSSSSISPYLKKTRNAEEYSASPDVWGENEEDEPLQNTGPLPPLNLDNASKKSKKKKSARLSVAVTADGDEVGPKKYPKTPIRRSTRLQKRPSLLPGLYPIEPTKKNTPQEEISSCKEVDLISWTTPTRPSFQRRSCRLTKN